MEVIDQSPAKDSVLYGRISQFWRKFLPALRRQKLSVILMVAGAGLLTYVGLQYWAMYHEQRALQREWQEQQKPSAGVAIGESLSKDDGLTRVSIPKINLDVIVVEGTNHRALRIGPGHLKNTPIPGELGNSVISAHRDTFFRHIYELNRGDEIEVRRNGRTYTFEVTGKKIVMPNDLSVVKNSSDARLTLIAGEPRLYAIGQSGAATTCRRFQAGGRCAKPATTS